MGEEECAILGKLICHFTLETYCSKATEISGAMQLKQLKNSAMHQAQQMTTTNIQKQGDSFRLHTEFFIFIRYILLFKGLWVLEKETTGLKIYLILAVNCVQLEFIAMGFVANRECAVD